MNRFGAQPASAGQAYCDQRLALDNFMSDVITEVGQDQSRRCDGQRVVLF